MTDLQQLLLDTLFNANVRASTREAVLRATLQELKITPKAFAESLTNQSQNAENIAEDRRERDRSQQPQGTDLIEWELRLMAGKSLD